MGSVTSKRLMVSVARQWGALILRCCGWLRCTSGCLRGSRERLSSRSAPCRRRREASTLPRDHGWFRSWLGSWWWRGRGEEGGTGSLPATIIKGSASWRALRCKEGNTPKGPSTTEADFVTKRNQTSLRDEVTKVEDVSILQRSQPPPLGSKSRLMESYAMVTQHKSHLGLQLLAVSSFRKADGNVLVTGEQSKNPTKVMDGIPEPRCITPSASQPQKIELVASKLRGSGRCPEGADEEAATTAATEPLPGLRAGNSQEGNQAPMGWLHLL